MKIENGSPEMLSDDRIKIRVITLRQPWASLIADGLKTIEARRSDRFRSLVGQRIGIHAGSEMGYDHDAWSVLPSYGVDEQRYGQCAVPSRVIVCVATVVGGRWLHDADSAAACCPARGLWGLILSDIEKIEPPVPVRGGQGIWLFSGELGVRRPGELNF